MLYLQKIYYQGNSQTIKGKLLGPSEIDVLEFGCVACSLAINDEIEFSNVLFANSVKDAINAPNMLAEMKVKYDHDTNPIIDFNKKNLYENIAF